MPQSTPGKLDGSARRRSRRRLVERQGREEGDPGAVGLIVFDELERAQCRRVLRNMERYFLRTQKGQERSRLIIPEPFFVHSDLTTGVQVADIVIYTIAWAYRYGTMDRPVRSELGPYCAQIARLVYKTTRPDAEGRDLEWPIWSIKYVDDLRARDEREAYE